MLDEIAAVRDRLRTDTPFFARHCLTILNENRQTQRLVPRPWQARTPATPSHVTPLDDALESQRTAGQPQRAIILKARKLGFSTWVQAKMMQRVSQWPHQYALTVAHTRGAAAVLYDMASLMWERLPNDAELSALIYGDGSERPAPFTVRPHRLNKGESRNGARWMVLGDPLRRVEASIYETLTAGAKGGGRASTPSIVHGSEVAHYEDPEYLGGVLNAVPKTPDSIVVLESTARGFNHFHERWVRAQDGAEDPYTGARYVPLFYGWQDNPANALTFLSDDARVRFEATIGDPDGGGDEEEVMLLEQFGVTLEQLLWRRVTRDDECGGDIEFFHQEHPATPEQAFIGSGQPVFPGILVAKMIKVAEAAPAPVEGVLRGLDWRERKTRSGTVRVPSRAVWVPRDQVTRDDIDLWGSLGRLAVWEHPLNVVTQEALPRDRQKPDGQYVVFADVAVGSGGTQSDGDWHAVQVLDHVSRMQVARFRSRIPVHDLPILLYLIAVYYNVAWLAPEVNGPGQGVIDALRNDLRYPLLYRRRTRGDDDRTDAAGHLLGWQTTLQSKPLMEQTFGQALREGTHGLRCVQTGREATTYVVDPKNAAKHGAQKGAYDDLLIAFMGAHRVAAELRPREPGKTRRVRGRDVVDPLTGW